MDNSFFYTGGVVPPEKWGIYIEREADDLLYKSLSIGDYCYILSSRQMGKTSLSRYTRHKLEKDGICCVYFELNMPGKNLTEEQWYFSITNKIKQETRFELDLDEWWINNSIFSPVERFTRFIDQLVATDLKVVIFIDEIDVVLSIDNFETDDFFAAIRGLFMERANDTRYKNITFALIGVAAPSDLMKDSQRTPFNIGKAIPLSNLEFEKAYPVLSKGLLGDESLKKEILKEVFKWTHGQPYLTQVICKKLAEREPVKKPDIQSSIKNIIEEASNDESTIGGHLGNIKQRILANHDYQIQMVSCYQKIFNGEEVRNIANNPAQIYLRLTGLLMQDKHRLVISNEIYRWYFDEQWINTTFYKINKYYAFLKQWLDSGRRELPVGINKKILADYKEWSTANTLTRDDYLFINFCDTEYHRQEKRQRRFLEVLGVITTIVMIIILGLTIKSLNVKMAASDKELIQKNEALQNLIRQKEKQNSFAYQYLIKVDQLDDAVANSKPQDTITLISKEVGQLDDSLLKWQEPNDVIKLLLIYNRNNTQKIRELSSRLDSIQKLLNICQKGISGNLPTPIGVSVKKYGKTAIMAICDKETDITYFRSGSFYNQLVQSLQNTLQSQSEVISAKNVNDYLNAQHIDLCATRYRFIEVAKYYDAERSIIVEFSGQNIRIRLYDVLKNRVIAQKDVTNDTKKPKNILSNIVSFVQQSF
ncbi:MAG: AAA-like domain-containing protein [Saprospiraceae bacterium]|nr:AAA-like domain-containing protein [Saprospiraceae bacterium]